jgi:hypothetical protein
MWSGFFPRAEWRVSTESRHVGRQTTRNVSIARVNSMTSEQTLRAALLTVETDDRFSEAILRFRDGSRLCFCHRVDERWAKPIGPESCPDEPGLAGALLADMTTFRLNAKHLDIAFQDGSRWDEALQNLPHGGRDRR